MTEKLSDEQLAEQDVEQKYKTWLKAQEDAGCWLIPEAVNPGFENGYEATFKAGHASRDAEVSQLEVRVNELERQFSWVPCCDRLPEEAGEYQVTALLAGSRTPYVNTYYFSKECGFTNDECHGKCIAWRPVPQPYRGEP